MGFLQPHLGPDYVFVLMSTAFVDARLRCCSEQFFALLEMFRVTGLEAMSTSCSFCHSLGCVWRRTVQRFVAGGAHGRLYVRDEEGQTCVALVHDSGRCAQAAPVMSTLLVAETSSRSWRSVCGGRCGNTDVAERPPSLTRRAFLFAVGFAGSLDGVEHE